MSFACAQLRSYLNFFHFMWFLTDTCVLNLYFLLQVSSFARSYWWCYDDSLFQYVDLYLTRVDGLRRRIATEVGDTLDYALIRDTFQVLLLFELVIFACALYFATYFSIHMCTSVFSVSWFTSGWGKHNLSILLSVWCSCHG